MLSFLLVEETPDSRKIVLLSIASKVADINSSYPSLEMGRPPSDRWTFFDRHQPSQGMKTIEKKSLELSIELKTI